MSLQNIKLASLLKIRKDKPALAKMEIFDFFLIFRNFVSPGRESFWVLSNNTGQTYNIVSKIFTKSAIFTEDDVTASYKKIYMHRTSNKVTL